MEAVYNGFQHVVTPTRSLASWSMARVGVCTTHALHNGFQHVAAPTRSLASWSMARRGDGGASDRLPLGSPAFLCHVVEGASEPFPVVPVPPDRRRRGGRDHTRAIEQMVLSTAAISLYMSYTPSYPITAIAVCFANIPPPSPTEPLQVLNHRPAMLARRLSAPAHRPPSRHTCQVVSRCIVTLVRRI